MYLIRIGSGPNRTIPCFLDVVFIGTFDYVKSAILEHAGESFSSDDFVETKRFFSEVTNSDIYAYTGPSFYVLIGSELDSTNHIAQL